MEDKELVEVWRKEFEETIDCKEYIKLLPSGTYSWEPTEFMWAGFQRAKNIQPSVVLPRPWMGDGFRVWQENEIDEALAASGIKYTIGE